MIFDEINPPESQQENYPIEIDDAFTPDQIEEIKNFKAIAQKKFDKNDVVLRGLESFFWGISSYSICKACVVYLGLPGINLAAAITLVMNQIVNRDCFDSFNLDRKDNQWEVTGMGKILKFAFGVLTSAFVFWSALGDVITFQAQSEQTYAVLKGVSEDFNRLPKEEQNEVIKTVILFVGGMTVIYGASQVNKR